MIKSISDLPAVAKYLHRIGAEAVNFRKARILQQVNGYPKEVGTIRFDTSNGSIRTTGSAESPTPEEAEAIAAELAAATLPELTTLASIDHLPQGVTLKDGSTLVFHDFEKRICMLQQRIEKDGGKDYVPWTRWTDGEWRRMEPGDKLPFWGLDAPEGHILFLHEGARAAWAVRQMIEGNASAVRFPWVEDMRFGVHIGWIGGTNAVHRSDWAKLAAMGWKNVYIITDNDHKGHNVAPKIAEHFRCPTFSLMLDRSFPLGFDMADPFPESKFTSEGRYIGEPFRNYLRPCTWATDLVPVGDGDRVVPVIREEFAEQWAWIKDHGWFVNLHLTQFKYENEQKFNAGMMPVSDSKNTAILLQKKIGSSQYGLTYDPSTDARVVTSSMGLSQINTYHPSPIQPVEGDYGPWLEFMDYLVPKEDDRKKLMRWCATLIHKTGTRMAYGVLMMTEKQGTGKTTLGEAILAELVGQHNTSFPSERSIADSDFNGWAVNKRLIVVNEIYHGHSWKAYNTLKSYVTDRHIEANIKFMATYTLPNWTHYYLSSNSKAALKIDNDDRRWLVPALTEEIWPASKFREFYAWLSGGGLSHIAWWAATYERRSEGKFIAPGETAPMTADKRRLINESESEELRLLADFADAFAELEQPTAISLNQLKEWAAEQSKERSFSSPDSIGRLMVKRGLFMGSCIKISGRKHWLLTNRKEMTEWLEPELRKAVRMPSDLISPTL